MKPIEIRQAIAEYCGWHNVAEADDELYGLPPYMLYGRGQAANYIVPYYENSLDALHEAEKMLSPQHVTCYLDNILICCIGDDAESNGSYEESYKLVTASAEQKSKAFLMTIGKWNETLNQKH